jgi:hypothetical protein
MLLILFKENGIQIKKVGDEFRSFMVVSVLKGHPFLVLSQKISYEWNLF